MAYDYRITRICLLSMRILINLMKYCYKSPYKLPVKQPVTAVDHKKWPMTI